MERRREQRKTFQHSIEYDLGSAFGASGKRRYTAHTRDISAYGLQILTNRPLKKGMVVRLDLQVSNVEISVPVFAEVAWAIPADKGFRAGLKYLK
jgi:hypothetical protein